MYNVIVLAFRRLSALAFVYESSLPQKHQKMIARVIDLPDRADQFVDYPIVSPGDRGGSCHVNIQRIQRVIKRCRDHISDLCVYHFYRDRIFQDIWARTHRLHRQNGKEQFFWYHQKIPDQLRKA